MGFILQNELIEEELRYYSCIVLFLRVFYKSNQRNKYISIIT